MSVQMWVEMIANQMTDGIECFTTTEIKNCTLRFGQQNNYLMMKNSNCEKNVSIQTVAVGCWQQRSQIDVSHSGAATHISKE